jgi:SAM-dependent methyltransferase
MTLAPSAKEVIGLDISPVAIDVANERKRQAGLTNLEFRCLPLSGLPQADKFDAIVCIGFLHHIQESEMPALLAGCRARLNQGGLFYSMDPDRNGMLRKVGRVVLGARYNMYHTPDERELDSGELTLHLKASGFKSVTIWHNDLTLIPAMWMLARRPGWPLYLCALVDYFWCHSPFSRWGSCFVAVAKDGP